MTVTVTSTVTAEQAQEALRTLASCIIACGPDVLIGASKDRLLTIAARLDALEAMAEGMGQ